MHEPATAHPPDGMEEARTGIDDGPVPMTRRQRGWAIAFAVALVLTSLVSLGTPTWLPDELLYAQTGAGYLDGITDVNLEHPPLAKLLFGIGQALTGSMLIGTRLVGALASLSIGAALFWLGRRIAGNAAGIAALGLWATLPHVGSFLGPLSQAPRLDRFGMLDPVATALAMGAVATGWLWFRRPSHRWAAMTGVLGGLAAAAKPTGMLVLVPIALLVLWAGHDRPREVVPQVSVAAVTSVAGFLVPYLLLFGTQTPDAIRALIEFQAQHANDGHTVTVAGTTTNFPPFWAHLWFHLRDDGVLLTGLVFGGAIAAVPLTRDRPPVERQGVLLVATTTCFLLVAFAAISVKLPFYRYAWLPLLVLLASIALARAFERFDDHREHPVGRLALTAVVFLLVPQSLVTIGRLVLVQPTDYAAAAERLASLGLEDAPSVVHARERILAEYLPDLEVVDDVEQARVVIVDEGLQSRFPREDLASVLTSNDWDCQESAGLTTCVDAFAAMTGGGAG